MRGLVKTQLGEGHVELLDVERREPGPEDVEVEIRRVAICGTDVQILHGRHTVIPPVILGHECCGVVSRVGEAVAAWEAGARVTLETAAEVCGNCVLCYTGRYHLCAKRRGLGTRRDGALSSHCVVRPDILHRLPEAVSDRCGALSNAFSIAIRAVCDRASVQAGDAVLVSGPGGIGLAIVQVARMQGARVVVTGVGRDADRLALARELGATDAIDVESDDAAQIQSGGFDVAFECSGVAAGVNLALQALKKQGTLVQVGMGPGSLGIDYETISMNELVVVGSKGHEWTAMERANTWMAEGRLNAEALISHEFPLSEWEDAFRIMEDGQGIRVLIDPAR